MADVRWIKIYTDMISNKKIKRIRKLPEGNNIVLIWVFLLAQAGECNKSGALYLTDAIPFRAEDLAIEFDFEVTVINLALITLERFSMIEVFDEIIYIKNWNEYQNIEGMDKIREQTRIRNIKYREKQKQLLLGDVSVTSRDATELELDLELEREKEKEKKNHEEVEETAMGAYIYSFKKLQYTGHIQDYVMKLMQRGLADSFVREVFLEMGERGISADVNYMRKMAEDWISKGITTRQEAKENRESQKVGGVSGGTKESVRQGGSIGNDKPTESSKSGILPSKYFKVDENGDLQVSGL